MEPLLKLRYGLTLITVLMLSGFAGSLLLSHLESESREEASWIAYNSLTLEEQEAVYKYFLRYNPDDYFTGYLVVSVLLLAAIVGLIYGTWKVWRIEEVPRLKRR